ncbi:Rne/Rng family ribonuclease [Roseibium salinum]|uniref:Ribonuclease E n=1 Tax=Roseibium salinum TaxID=1604349 RepID=A0ABT3QZV3_9HYPH|nr:ribonuclease E/G [Roseibium sp. DSM 29163]MCW1404537.1 ribonuclease E/G [Novosphingobium sp. MW5]MCX2722499.1 ribonuclease E/G [Roseibium sp. DSM 29163]
MANKMLIDAGHPEETRVVVVRGNRVEEFDFEAANRKQLRGNIYLAKVTRVEPSLQAAFVEYGGNRHGFLAFSEIHPDYYQIPLADREALLAAEAAERQRDEGDAEEKPKRRRRSRAAKNEASETVSSEKVGNGSDEDNASAEDDDEALAARAPDDAEGDDASGSTDNSADEDDEDEAPVRSRGRRGRRRKDEDDDEADNDDDAVESVGAEDAMEEVPERRAPMRKHYKIQEVIKRRQIILVQVVKEERGNKGAALTTYLSLAGRYSVLMPNTARGGGISRKITQPTDRKRLKTIASELDVPEGMGVILRTAGASRTKAEIKRDFEYLMRLWENVRELTLKSSAPSLVYEEGSLIKRSIRDLYNKDINEVLVAGEEGYREAKDFMRMLMPSHAKNVQPYRDPSPLFIRYGVEPQLDAMFSPQVTLKSGGYIVINQTEALVSIDVNSGKSTREHNIEDTALQTNLEAAEEVTRQLRLRDLAGLIVIDFIDMEESKNNRSVERKLKDCLKNDRARIQVGRISHFGLLEMSRQRIRTGVLESSTTPCPHCQGTGMIRSVESVALHVLRSIEDNLLKGASHNLIIRTTTQVALYILNQKRSNLVDLERRFAIGIEVHADDTVNGQLYVLERGTPVDRERFPVPSPYVQPDTVDLADEIDDIEEVDETEEQPEVEKAAQQDDDDGDRRRKRRRKRRRGGSDSQTDDSGETRQATADGENSDDDGGRTAETRSGDEDGSDDEPRRKRRRGRRGGRRGRRGDGAEAQGDSGESDTTGDGEAQEAPETREPQTEQPSLQADEAEAPAQEAASGAEAEAGEQVQAAEVNTSEAPEPSVEDVAAAPEAVTSREDIVVETPTSEQPVASETPEKTSSAPAEPVVTSESSDDDEDKEDKPKRVGWWQRGRSFF